MSSCHAINHIGEPACGSRPLSFAVTDRRRSQSALCRHLAGARGARGPPPLRTALYCARGEMENRIKECQLDLYADRTSAHTMRANQLRLWFAAMAYGLICALRRIGLAHTQFARASCGTTWFWAAFLMATHSTTAASRSSGSPAADRALSRSSPSKNPACLAIAQPRIPQSQERAIRHQKQPVLRGVRSNRFLPSSRPCCAKPTRARSRPPGVASAVSSTALPPPSAPMTSPMPAMLQSNRITL